MFKVYLSLDTIDIQINITCLFTLFQAGNWIDGKLTGVGRLKFINGDEYSGDLVDALPHGHGTMKCGR